MKVGSLVRTTSSPTRYLVVKIEDGQAVYKNGDGNVAMVTAVNVVTGAYQSLPSQCYEVISESR